MASLPTLPSTANPFVATVVDTARYFVRSKGTLPPAETACAPREHTSNTAYRRTETRSDRIKGKDWKATSRKPVKSARLGITEALRVIVDRPGFRLFVPGSLHNIALSTIRWVDIHKNIVGTPTVVYASPVLSQKRARDPSYRSSISPRLPFLPSRLLPLACSAPPVKQGAF